MPCGPDVLGFGFLSAQLAPNYFPFWAPTKICWVAPVCGYLKWLGPKLVSWDFGIVVRVQIAIDELYLVRIACEMAIAKLFRAKTTHVLPSLRMEKYPGWPWMPAQQGVTAEVG